MERVSKVEIKEARVEWSESNCGHPQIATEKVGKHGHPWQTWWANMDTQANMDTHKLIGSHSCNGHSVR